MEENVTFQSDGLTLTGVVHIPDDIQPGEHRPAVMVLHGFGSKKESNNCTGPCKMLADWGYIAMRFDFRGCGESEGEYGRLICLEQVSDTSNALSYLQSRADVDPGRIGALGSSFGALEHLNRLLGRGHRIDARMQQQQRPGRDIADHVVGH